jgi:hypothetical protein
MVEFFCGIVLVRVCKEAGMQRVLVLNASYEPLQLVSLRRALVLLFQEKAELVESSARYL